MNAFFTIDQNFDFNQQIEQDKIYNCIFFGGFNLQLVLTSTSSQSITQIIEYSIVRPVVSIRFYNEGDNIFFCYCCQNVCCIILVTESTHIISLLNKMRNYFIIYLNQEDYGYLQSNNINYPSLTETQMNELFNESKSMNAGYFDGLNFRNDNTFTFSKYLFLTHSLISSFFIRRNYYSISEFQCSIPVDCPNHSFEQFTANDFCFIRTIQTEQVKLCLNLKHGYLCVLKSFPYRSTYELEKERHSQLKYHPNIVNCFGFIDDDPSNLQPSLVYEFSSHISLDYMFDNNVQIDDTIKTKIIYQILGGLDYLHQEGMIHQNLTPENILINSNYDVSLTHLSGCRIYKGEGQFEPAEGMSFHDDLGLFGLLIYEVIYMKPVWSKKDYPNLTSWDRLSYINEHDMPPLSIEIGSIIELYEKCIHQSLNNRISTFLYLKEYQNYYYYFYNSNLHHLLAKVYETQIVQSPRRDLRKDVQYYIHKSNENDADSLYLLGVFYKEGAYYEEDHRTSLRKFQQASNYFCSEALFELIKGTLNGINTGISEDMSLNMLRDFVSGSGNIGPKFFYSKFVIENQTKFHESDVNKAVQLLVEIRDSSSEAQSYLGKMMLEGQIFQQDVSSAISYFEHASMKCSSEAVLNLGTIYDTGFDNIVSKDPTKSLKYYFLSASLRNETSLKILISKYNSLEFGYQRQTLKLLKIGAKQRITAALNFIGFYQIRLANDKENKESKERKDRRIWKGIRYLTIAADQNDLESSIRIAKEYYFHYNVEQDIKKAFKYYQIYKKLGGTEVIKDFENSSSITTFKSTKKDKDLTIDFYSGLFIERGFSTLTIDNFYESNDHDAMFLKTQIMLKEQTSPFNKIIRVLKESSQTNSYAQNELGKIYAYSIGTEQNIDEAIRLFTLAAKNGHNEAQYHLGMLMKEKDPNLSLAMLKQSSSNNYLNALYEMGLYHANKKELRVAKSYLRSAIIQKHAYSYYMLGLLSDDEKVSTEIINLFKTAASINCIDAENKLSEMNKSAKLFPGRCIGENKAGNKGHFYECFTCGIINGLKICAFCARTKHSDHMLLDLGEIDDAPCCQTSPL